MIRPNNLAARFNRAAFRFTARGHSKLVAVGGDETKSWLVSGGHAAIDIRNGG
jgi:hypothetical protein